MAKGVYTEYLDRQFGFDDLNLERKRQLQRISELRGGRDVLVYAADLNHTGTNAHIINYTDLLPISDQLAVLRGRALDFILETPGGSGETAEDIVRMLRDKYDDVAVIVPGWAKSAGTIIAMAADDILMEPNSALGPIDAQLSWQGKTYSAGALLEQWQKIRDETQATGVLNKAYIPLLQMMSLGELQSAENHQDFGKKLVTSWLIRYKFHNWTEHRSTGAPVTDEERKSAAEHISHMLSNHSHWLVHGRSIKIPDLEELGLRITNYALQPQLANAIRRYHTLVQMTFETNAYKLFETPASQIFRFMNPLFQGPQPSLGPDTNRLIIDITCNKCGHRVKLHPMFEKGAVLEPGAIPFPPDNRLRCPSCGTEHDLGDIRRQLEAQVQRPIVD